MKPRRIAINTIIAGAVIASSASTAENWPPDANSKGYIKNDAGEKCSYRNRGKMGATYFHDGLTGNLGILTFDNPSCMRASDARIGHDVNKMMINNIITRWYSHDDADFETRVGEMYDGSMSQKRGQCIQSATYSAIGVTVDYVIEGDAIIRVYHGSSIMGCK